MQALSVQQLIQLTHIYSSLVCFSSSSAKVTWEKPNKVSLLHPALLLIQYLQICGCLSRQFLDSHLLTYKYTLDLIVRKLNNKPILLVARLLFNAGPPKWQKMKVRKDRAAVLKLSLQEDDKVTVDVGAGYKSFTVYLI